MNIKKGFMKTQWPVVAILLFAVFLAVQSRDLLMVALTVLILASLIWRYRKYDEIEQIMDTWWNNLPKDDKIKIKESQLKESEPHG